MEIGQMKHTLFCIGVAAVVLALVIGMVWGIAHLGDEHARLIGQCMDAGKQEWECHAALDSHESTTVIPVVVGR